MKYLVMAYRYGTNEYVFPIGIFTERDAAVDAAIKHRTYRGGKYDHKLFVIEESHLYDAWDDRDFWITGERA